MDKKRFQEAIKMALSSEENQKGIGTLGEKTLHSVLKYYFEPNKEFHEIKTGRYFADIRYGDEIIEIQTGNFSAIRKKLKILLESHIVTLVYPIAAVKNLCWIDNDTHEVTKKRKSPKSGRIYDAFIELYRIKQNLINSNLTICIILLEIDEYRLLDGWSKDKKKGSSRYERVPKDIIDEIYVGGGGGYSKLIPSGLPFAFNSADFAKACNISRSNAQTALNILTYTEDVLRIGKDGNAYIYSLKK